MSSYRKHVLLSVIMTLPFFPYVLYLSLAIVGASIIDLDHPIKKKNLMYIAIFGIILSIILYILKLPFINGLFLFLIAVIFFISKHRGFMHSFIGIFIIAGLLTLLVLSFYFTIQDFTISNKISLMIISLVFGVLFLNKKLIPIFCVLVPLGIFFTPFPPFNIYNIFAAVFLGCMSHIFLDLLTPSGLELFNPLSSKKCKKSWGIFLLILWGFSVIFYLFLFFNLWKVI